MAKLSIWLITVDKTRPFTFLDHALKCGDSLLGICSLSEIENYSLRPGVRQLTFTTANLFRYVDEASKKRRELESVPSNDQEQISIKTHLHSEAEAGTAKVRALADIITAFELFSAKQEEESYETARASAAAETELLIRGPVAELQATADQRLRGYHTFHWPIQFPEVFAKGGFDAFIGNPPFLWALRISIRISIPFSHFLKRRWPHARKNADLCAYFVLRAASLLRSGGGTAGLVLTNTIAEADTRETALDYVTSEGHVIYRAMTSLTWPGTASVRVSPVHLFRGAWHGDRYLDGAKVDQISTSLEPVASTKAALPLASNMKHCFKGSVPLGDGFFLRPDEVEELRKSDSKNADVIFAYMTGEELNSSPTLTPGRWVIYFRDWELERCEAYQDCLELVRKRVKPERDKIVPTNGMALQRRDLWWKFTGPTVELYDAIRGMNQVLVASAVSKHHAFVFVPASYIYSNALNIFAYNCPEQFALLQSSLHAAWASKQGSRLKTDPRYNVTDCFETFPFPQQLDGLARVGSEYHAFRQSIMANRTEGLTKIYNRFHNPEEKSADIEHLRVLHLEMDHAVAHAYGWTDLDLGHSFQIGGRGARYVPSESASRTVLERLLALNYERKEQEVSIGILKKKAAPRSDKKGLAKRKAQQSSVQGELL